MPDFSKRSYQKELLDRDDIPFEDIKRNMQELEFINKYLGGHQITIAGITSLLANHKKNTITICEIGCGGGDNLKAISDWCKSKDLEAKFIGIDINKDCITYAKENCKDIDCDFILSDYKKKTFEINPDIIFSSLFCHHFTNEELVGQLNWMKENSFIGFFINDLHRHPLAYYSIKLLTRLFSKSYLVKNDAPLSVERGFRKDEIQKLVSLSACNRVNIKWKWAFRWLIIFKH
ncbi:MAG: methyltransferase domain-containing protein [Sphingobacteriales bacterium]|nr:MAG: methyltransferase domain-containing protein [Sphingobacteriales bacterium]